ncbi:Elongation factor Ts, mitochondrial [Paramarasmius palmivorus]|uniref:Elongation factor Ts, mitochondrial n=1 Tax=Paramarasmius palmivorus TaxID=297713 RepID=A0AAW0E0Y6_9AGAR
MFKFPRVPLCLRLQTQRLYSTSKPKTTVQLVSELRKLTNAPILKARQALTETNNDFDAALEWLEKDLLASGAAKAEKIKDRQASEGLVSINVAEGVVPKAAIVELNCESDFVSRTDEFVRLAADIAQTVTQLPSSTSEGTFSAVDLAALLEQPLVSTHKAGGTVQSSITDLIARIGENITLRRAALLAPRETPNVGFRVASYLHNPVPNFPTLGRIGTLALLSYRSPQLSQIFADGAFLTDAEKLERALCRQIVGCNALSVKDVGADEETVLYKQPFAMLGGAQSGLPVRQVMDEWQNQKGLEEFEVADFVRWEVGQSSK